MCPVWHVRNLFVRKRTVFDDVTVTCRNYHLCVNQPVQYFLFLSQQFLRSRHGKIAAPSMVFKWDLQLCPFLRAWYDSVVFNGPGPHRPASCLGFCGAVVNRKRARKPARRRAVTAAPNHGRQPQCLHAQKNTNWVLLKAELVLKRITYLVSLSM